MRNPKLQAWLTEMELLDWVRSSDRRVEHEHRLAVWLTYLGYPAAEVGRMLGVSPPSIRRWVGGYNRQGRRRLPHAPQQGQHGLLNPGCQDFGSLVLLGADGVRYFV